MRSLVGGLCAAALVLGLSGCSEKAPAPVEPTSSATARPSTVPTMPPKAGDASHRGLTRFIEYYLDVLSDAFESGETATLEALSADSCSTCQSFVDAIAQVYDAGGSVRGGRRTFEGADVRFLGPDAESFVSTDVTIAAATKRDFRESPPSKTNAGIMRLTFVVRGVGDERQVVAIFKGDPQ